MGMILDALAPFQVISAPEARRRPRMRWVTCPDDARLSAGTEQPPRGTAPDEIVHVTSADGYATARAAHPEGLIVTCAPGGDAPCSDDRRAIVLDTDAPLVYVYLALQRLLMDVAAWGQDLASLVEGGGTLEMLLDASRDALPCYVFVADKNSCVLAQSSGVQPPDEFHRAISLSGFVSGAQGTGARLAAGDFTLVAGEGGCRDRLVFPLYLDHGYAGMVSMACPAEGATAGLRDRLGLLIGFVEHLCADMLASHVSLNIPHLHFFDLLLDDQRFDRATTRAQLEALRIPPDSWFKVVVVDIDEAMEPAKASLIAMTFLAENRVHTRCFLHNGTLVALQYAPSAPELSHLRTEAILASYAYTRFDSALGVSDPFSSISQLRYAFDEACIALDLRNAITCQRDVESTSRRRGNTFFFYEAAPYYFVDAAPKDEGFMNFVFQISFLPFILEEDAAKGTSDFRLLWTYLLNERNATKTAQVMYVHRNTVLYRIDKIQERFKIDLNDSNMREKLVADYRMFFLSQGKFRWDEPPSGTDA
ncbi:MAG: PucR family transcriptional regulator [Eggerthellaceae bacterium]|nr:PucR family transcriptional regulator [Eggerthellaceae bacterium]